MSQTILNFTAPKKQQTTWFALNHDKKVMTEMMSQRLLLSHQLQYLPILLEVLLHIQKKIEFYEIVYKDIDLKNLAWKSIRKTTSNGTLKYLIVFIKLEIFELENGRSQPVLRTN